MARDLKSDSGRKANAPMFERLFAAVFSRQDLATDAELLTRAGRLARREELFAVANDVLGMKKLAVTGSGFRTE